MERQQTNYNGLDLGKILMAMIVVAMHTHPLADCSNQIVLRVWDNIKSVAVPFFFVTTSWLFFSCRDDIYSKKCMEDLRKRIFYFIRLYVLWEIVYLPCVLWGYCHNGYSLIFNVVDYVRKFLFVGSNYYSSQFWFVLTMIYSLVILYIFLKRKFSLSKIFIISCLLLAVGSTMNYLIKIKPDSASGLLWTFVSCFSSMCTGSTVFPRFIYIVLGMIMAKRRIILSKAAMLICLMVGIWGQLMFFDGYILYDLAILIEVIVVFQIFLQLRLHDHFIYRKLRELSVVMFYTHFYFIFLYELIFRKPLPTGLKGYGVCLLCCLILTSVVIYLKKYRQFRWLKMLFG